MEVDERSGITQISHTKNIVAIFGIIIILGLGLSLYMYSIDNNALTYYGDSISHLGAARKLFDWAENPGWNQIGTVWLPLPHVLLMLPSMVDALFFSGFAGLAVSLPSLAGTSILLYKMVTRLLMITADAPNANKRIFPYVAFAVALLYATNPNFLYLGITAMTEAPFMLFFVASAYFLLRWHEEEKQQEFQQQGQQNKHSALKYLLVSSIFAAAATLCRYEGWILPLFLVLYASTRQIAELWTRSRNRRRLVIKSIEKENEGDDDGVMAANTYQKVPNRISIRIAIYTVLVSTLSLSGIVFWIAYNAVSYGDPLAFEHIQYYSAASQALSRPFRENLYFQPYNVANVYGLTALIVYGPVILAAAAVGYYYQRRRTTKTITPKKEEGTDRPKNSIRYLYIFLGLPPAFTIISMLIGIGEMTFWFNSRFIILLAPLLMVLAGFYIARQPKKIANNRVFLTGIVAALFAFQLVIIPAFSAVVTLDDAFGGYAYKYPPYAIETGKKLHSLYDGTGSIMVITGSAQEHRILLASGIAFRNFDSIIESSTWKNSFHEPWKYNDKWIVMAKDPDSDAASTVRYWTDNKSTLFEHYHTIFENKYYEILALK